MMQCYGQLKRHHLRAGTEGFCLETHPILPSASTENGQSESETLVGCVWLSASL